MARKVETKRASPLAAALLLVLACGSGRSASTAPDGAAVLATCGNGQLDEGEQCDDGNRLGGDGCTGLCQIASGYVCPALGQFCEYRGDAGAPRCPGTAAAQGTLLTGPFVATASEAELNVSRPTCGRTINIYILDTTHAAQIELVLPVFRDAGVDSVLGSATVDVRFGQRSSTTLQTSGSINVTSVVDPFNEMSVTFGPWGMIEGTFAIDADGVSVSGSFATPFCVSFTYCGD